MTLRPNLFKTFCVSALAWYGALSQSITVSSCQPGATESNVVDIYFKNRTITSLSVAAWAKLNQTFPFVSNAAIIDSLGETVLSLELPNPFLSVQTFRMKLVSLSQVSSIFIMRVPYSRSSSSLIAYYCRWIITLGELALTWSFLAFTKLRPICFFIVSLTSFLLTIRFLRSLTEAIISWVFLIG